MGAATTRGCHGGGYSALTPPSEAPLGRVATGTCERTVQTRSVFAAVIGDAALIAEVIDVDTHGRDPRAVPGAPAPPRADAGAFSSSLPPTQREIEGAGGEMWYEARHIGAGRAA